MRIPNDAYLQKSCPICTYENAYESTHCAMCKSRLGVDQSGSNVKHYIPQANKSSSGSDDSGLSTVAVNDEDVIRDSLESYQRENRSFESVTSKLDAALMEEATVHEFTPESPIATSSNQYSTNQAQKSIVPPSPSGIPPPLVRHDSDNYSSLIEMVARRKSEEAAMMKSSSGRAIRLVEKVMKLARSFQLETIAADGMVYLAERFVETHDAFWTIYKPSSITVGYHTTNPHSLDAIRTHGLLSRGERGGYDSEGHHLYFGDGIYISNNPQAFLNYGEVGIMVASLVGKTRRIERCGMNLTKNEDLDAGVGNKRLHKRGYCKPEIGAPFHGDEIVLRTAGQCVPLITYPTAMVISADGANRIKECEKQLNTILRDFFPASSAGRSL
eukprot:CAMPEP_0194219632 /NCGR_PEP_ID=MMETSP0156-20130528/26435_1 /TAXON_ID=33649 /ORGANISM="Thalassionema nitzschioides, Strain L26-B" /LENGTH=385 /DNA_ID=CAMNT_0038949383 /DNA_START=11 /DNA_END=1168 /DNA_ORIENTATION=+